MTHPATAVTAPASHPNPRRWRILGLLGIAR